MQDSRSNADRTRETRAALIRAARALFLEKGYAETGTPELADRAGVTRGALYHHFADKRAIFLAVVEAEATEIAAGIDDAGAAAADTPLGALLAGAQAYFRVMRAPGRTRLMLLEGPAVLGTAEMRRIDLGSGGRTLRAGLAALIGTRLTEAEIDARAELLSALFDRATLAIEAGADQRIYEEAVTALLPLLVGVPSG
jgi:AcrR family transcriptional regulator